MKINIETEFDLKQVVYLITDTEQLPRMVIAVSIMIGKVVMYTLNYADTSSEHYECEISKNKDVVGNL